MTRSRPEKLSRIDEVNMLNLGLRKTKQETTVPQIISFHRTPQCEKGKHRTPKGLRSPQHRKLRFYRRRQNLDRITDRTTDRTTDRITDRITEEKNVHVLEKKNIKSIIR